MLDIKFIRENPEVVKEAAKNKNVEVDVDRLLNLDGEVVALRQELDVLRQKRNENAESMKGEKPSDQQIEEGKRLKDEIAELEIRLNPLEEELLNLMYAVPNIPETEVPVGASEEENVVVAEFGEKPSFNFKPKNHWELAQAKGWIDKERAAKVAGSRFAYIKGDLARMHWALMQFGMDVLTDEAVLKEIIEGAKLNISSKPFELVMPPVLIKTEAFQKTARLNKEEVTYKIDGEEQWLGASAEHSVCNMHMGEVLAEETLPKRYLAYATSFRKEAGTYGKDMEGIVRLHQFDKLEMESFTKLNDGKGEHLLLVEIQKWLMTKLKLPFRLLEKCTADIGNPNAKGMDIDAWLPGQDSYRETHTADYMRDFQTRRLNTRVKLKDGGLELAATNDATAFSQRPLIAIIENYQTEDGDVVVPEVLRPYMGGRERI
jgi:seryl-tRNA synthetase